MKKIIALILVLIMAASLAACGSGTSTASPSASEATDSSAPESTDSGTAPESADPVPAGGKIGVMMPTKTLERWNRDGAFLKREFEAKGYTVDLIYSDDKVAKQVSDLENLIAGKVDLLVIVAIDGESLSTALQGAVEAKIPVIAYDRLIKNTDAVAYYVSFDNYTVGKLQGQYVIDTLKLDLNDTSKSYNIEFTAGDPADNNATFFFNGAMDTLKPYLDAGILKCPSGQTKFEQVGTAGWKTEKALNRFQDILASYYADGTVLDIALCSNDSTALGVAQAIGSDYAETNTVLITGQDGDEANLKNMIDGKQSMTVYKAVANEAVVTVSLGEAMLKGETPDGSLIDKAGWSFDCAYDTSTYDNGSGIVPSYLLDPLIVTKDNIQKELIDTGYYTMGTDGYPKAVG